MTRLTNVKCFKPFLKFALVLSASSTVATAAFALDLKPEEIRGNNEHKPVSVLQNRYFLKAMRPEFGLSAGTFLNEAYTDTSTAGAHTALFINEWIGFEVQYLQTSIQDSDDRKALNEKEYRDINSDAIVSPDPEINRIHKIAEANAIFAPFYGKINLMNKIIVYSDLYFTTGLSKIDTDQGDINAVILGAGQRFYWNDAFSLRIDYRDRIYYEKRADERTRKNAHAVDFGISYFFL